MFFTYSAFQILKSQSTPSKTYKTDFLPIPFSGAKFKFYSGSMYINCITFINFLQKIDASYAYTDAEFATSKEAIKRTAYKTIKHARYGIDLNHRPATNYSGLHHNGIPHQPARALQKPDGDVSSVQPVRVSLQLIFNFLFCLISCDSFCYQSPQVS